MNQSSWLREFARYSSLNVLGMTGLSFYILADTFFVSQGLGTDGLAALNLAIPFYSMIQGTALMLGMGGGSGLPSRNTRDRKKSTGFLPTPFIWEGRRQ